MSDISCRVFEFFERHAETYGYSLEDLTADSGASLEVLKDPSQRVSWEVWAAICERFEELVGGPDETVRAGERIIEMGFSAPMRTIGGALMAPDLIYEAVVRWLGPYFFRNLTWRIDKVAPGNVIIDIAVPEHQPASPAWFRMALGSFVKVPQAINAADAIVSVRVSGREARFDVRCEPSNTLWSRLRTWSRAVFRPGQLLQHLEELQADLRSALGQAVAGQNELRRTLVALPDPVAVVRSDTVLWCNSAWRNTVGERLPANLHALHAGNVVHLDSAEQRAYEVTEPVAITWEGNAAELVLLRDITQVRQLAEHMRIADRLGALGMIAASVGHEINNPLAVALGSLDLTLTDPELDAQSRENLERAVEALKQAAGVTSDLLTVARDSGELENVDMNDVIKTALRLAGNEFRHVPDLMVDVSIAEDIRAVRGSRQRLTQVVLNLLVNAAHALVETPAPAQRISLRAENEGDRVCICVEDNGPGIPAALLANVKEPFFTTKGRSGSGLGLAVCERIVAEHDGVIELENLMPRGTLATVRLPGVDALASSEETAPTATTRPDIPLRILMVDDQRELCDIVTSQLWPHEVVAAHSYDEALGVIAEDGRFDVVLLDVMLAGESGIALRDALPLPLQARAIFITGGVFLQEEDADFSAQDNPVLTKPFTREALLESIEAVASANGRFQHSA